MNSIIRHKHHTLMITKALVNCYIKMLTLYITMLISASTNVK